MFSLHDFAHIFFPRTCHLCHRALIESEVGLCLVCQSHLPRLPRHLAEDRLAGKFPFVRCASYCYYEKRTPYSHLLRQAKYGGKPRIDYDLAMLFARELEREGWPMDIDAVVPVPVHWRRRFTRGYNQSAYIARAIGRRWHLRVEERTLGKAHYTTSQVHHSFAERQLHQAGSFAVRHAERIAGCHLLLVDDILTSGATLSACADALLAVSGVRISILTLGLSH